jgi:DNA-binding transcriptional ArsR family regulator
MVIELIKDTSLKSKIEFRISGVSEFFMSLNVLGDPSHHIECLEWSNKMSGRLTKEQLSDIAYFYELCREWLGVFDLIGNDYYRRRISEVIGTIKEAGDDEFKKVLHKCDQKCWELRVCDYSDDEILESYKDDPTFDEIKRIIKNPGQTRERMVDLLEAYHPIFDEEFGLIKERLIAYIQQKYLELKNMDVINFLESLDPEAKRIHSDESRTKLIIEKPFRLFLKTEKLQNLVILPSLFVAPHLFISADEADEEGDIKQFMIIFGAPYAYKSTVVVEKPTMNLVDSLKAFSDEVRLEILGLLKIGDMTTKEIAGRLGMTEPSVSRHLKLLRFAKLVSQRPEGNFVYYSLNEERMNELFGQATNYILKRNL